MKSLPLSNAINNELSGYYRSLEDSEYPLSDRTGKWLDLSPFVLGYDIQKQNGGQT